jgi:hypothetical protein
VDACELAHLLPPPDARGVPTVKVEELEDAPPSQTGGVPVLMDGLEGDACSDLVSNFVDDVVADPVSLDDFLEM